MALNIDVPATMLDLAGSSATGIMAREKPDAGC
jgi:hypothetical protein